MDPTQIADLVAQLAQQLADQQAAAAAATERAPWSLWAIGYGRKIFDCGIMVLAAFVFLSFLDMRNAKRLGDGGFSWALKEIRGGNVGTAVYFGLRYSATILAMALVWKTS